MSRKDYVLIADALAACLPSRDASPVAFSMFDAMVKSVAQALDRDNARFDYGRFVAAAGLRDSEARQQVRQDEGTATDIYQAASK